MKPGKMKNMPMLSGHKGLSAVEMLAAHSLNTPATTQQSMDANRMVPRHQASGPSGRANIEGGDVLDGMPIDTPGTKATQGARKRLLM